MYWFFWLLMIYIGYMFLKCYEYLMFVVFGGIYKFGNNYVLKGM